MNFFRSNNGTLYTAYFIFNGKIKKNCLFIFYLKFFFKCSIHSSLSIALKK